VREEKEEVTKGEQKGGEEKTGTHCRDMKWEGKSGEVGRLGREMKRAEGRKGRPGVRRLEFEAEQ
jgi:hypothetical protein